MYNLSFQNYTFSDIYEKMYSLGYPFLVLPAPIQTNKKESSVHAAPFRVCFHVITILQKERSVRILHRRLHP